MPRRSFPGLVLAVAALASACADDASESESAQRAAKTAAAARATATERSAAQPASAAPSAAADLRALDAVVAGRAARQWLDTIANERDPGSPAARAARAALGADPDAAAAALLALLVESPADGWTRVRAFAQDLRDGLVPGLVGLLSNDDPAVVSAAFAELKRMARSGGFGPHDALVVAAFVADGLDGTEHDVLLAMGPGAAAAMPYLARALRDDPAATATYLELLRGLGPAAEEARGAVLALLAQEDLGRDVGWNVQGQDANTALEALAAMGADADGSTAAALRRLLASHHDPVWTGPLTRALVALGESDAAVTELLRRIREGTDAERATAFGSLQHFVPPPPGAVAAAAQFVQDPDDRTRTTAVWALAAWASADAEALAALLAAAGAIPFTAPAYQGHEALWALLFSHDGRSGTPLDAALASPSADVRIAAIRLVPSLVPTFPVQGARFLRRLRVLAKEGEEATAAAARAAVDAIERSANERAVAMDFVARLTGWDAVDRARAASELPEAEVAGVVQGLVRMLTSRDAGERYMAPIALEALGPRAAAAIPALAARLNNGAVEGWDLAPIARAIGAIGGEGVALLRAQVRIRGEISELQEGIARLPESSARAMLEALGDADDDVRAAFIRGLGSGRFAEHRETIRTRAREMLHDVSATVRVAAAGALLAMDPNETQALSVIASVLHGEIAAGDAVLADAVWEAARLGSGASPLVPDLVRVLRSPVGCPTWADAARAVQRCGAAAAPAVTALAAGLDGRVACPDEYCSDRSFHPQPTLRAAATALAALGPVAEPARASLERARNHANLEVRDAVRRALASLEDKRASVAER